VGGVGPHHYLARRNFDKFWISNEQARKLVKKGQARVTNSLSKQKNLET
jgi:hypothetical protein